MTNGGVGRRDMVEAERHFRFWAWGDEIRPGASRNQPHHELDAFRSRLTDVFDVGRLRQTCGIVDQTVEEFVVPLLVDQTGARPLKLMAHAASAPDMDVDVLWVAHDRFADCPAERQ